MIKKALLAAILVLLVYSLAGCQTVKGFGKDMQWLGEKMSGDKDGE